MSIRERLSEDKLIYLDGVASIVATLYQEGDLSEKLGSEPDELQQAVYSLGQAYMLLYQELLAVSDLDGET